MNILNIKKNVMGLLFLSLGALQAADPAQDAYSRAEQAEVIAAVAKFPANLYKGRFSQEIKWAMRAAHAGLALHNKPDDRQQHNKFWLLWSLVNISSLIAERANIFPALEQEPESAFEQELGQKPEQKPEQKYESPEDTLLALEQMANGFTQDKEQSNQNPNQPSFNQALAQYIKTSPLLLIARKSILPALESGLAVYCATNKDDTDAGRRKRIRAQALCSIVMALSEYMNAHPKSLESGINLALVVLGVLKACDDFFIYDPAKKHVRFAPEEREIRRVWQPGLRIEPRGVVPIYPALRLGPDMGRAPLGRVRLRAEERRRLRRDDIPRVVRLPDLDQRLAELMDDDDDDFPFIYPQALGEAGLV